MLRALLKQFDTPLPEADYRLCLRLREAVTSAAFTRAAAARAAEIRSNPLQNETAAAGEPGIPAPCTLCSDNCPTNAISLANGIDIDPEHCNSCGVCTAICPSGALTHRRQDVGRLDGVAGMSVLSIGCMLGSDSGRTWLLPQDSVCGLSWEFIAAAVLRSASGKLLLDCRYCEECRNGAGISAVHAAADRAGAFAGILGIKAEIKLVVSADGAVVPDLSGKNASARDLAFSRREFFQAFAGKTQSTIRLAAEETGLFKGSAITLRELLWNAAMETKHRSNPVSALASSTGSTAISGAGFHPAAAAHLHNNKGHNDKGHNDRRTDIYVFQKTALPWGVFRLTPGCSGCGTCSQVCPHQAWQIHTSGRTRTLTFTARQCRNCGTCAAACPEQVIRSIVPEGPALEATQKGETVMALIQGRQCRRCGKFLTHRQDSYCPNCAKQASV